MPGKRPKIYTLFVRNKIYCMLISEFITQAFFRADFLTDFLSKLHKSNLNLKWFYRPLLPCRGPFFRFLMHLAALYRRNLTVPTVPRLFWS